MVEVRAVRHAARRTHGVPVPSAGHTSLRAQVNTVTTDPPSVAGLRVPDTALAREATQLVRDTTSELVFHHSRRVFWFGALQGRNRDLGYDPELLYIGAMFHDLGLGERFRTSGRRFEVDSADEARRFLQGHHVPEDSVRRVWTAIALHTTPGIPQYLEPEVALVTAGVEYDVLGIGYRDISEEDRSRIVALHPRPDFKQRILGTFTDGIREKPETTFGNVKADVLEHYVPGFERGDFVRTILDSPWPE